MELKQIEHSWLRPRTNLSSSSLSKVGLLHFGWLGCQKYQHDDNLCPWASIHLISILFPPIYDKRWLIDGKFRGVSAMVDGFMSIAMFRGGRRQISPGCWFEIPILILNNNQLQLLDRKGINQRLLVYPSNFYANKRSPVPVWKGMEANWCENSTIFIVKLGSRRPPRRVRAYNSTNNHELNNTLMVPSQGIYLVIFYGH